MSHVAVTDPRHALWGQRFPLLPVRSARGPAFIVIELPGGRWRSLRRSVTDLAEDQGVTSKPHVEAPRISARTLLPLARYVAAGLAASAVEVPHGDRSPPVAEAAARGDTVASAVAELAGRDASADRPAPGRPAAAAAAEGGEQSC